MEARAAAAMLHCYADALGLGPRTRLEVHRTFVWIRGSSGAGVNVPVCVQALRKKHEAFELDLSAHGTRLDQLKEIADELGSATITVSTATTSTSTTTASTAFHFTFTSTSTSF